MKKILIALGGNAILKKGEKPSISNQFENTEKALSHIVNIIKRNKVVITHGNGPQVGNILIRVEEALKEAYPIPLEVCVAESQGEMGYMIEQTLINLFKKHRISKPVVSILTQVLVDKKDPAFRKPTKPIGPFYTKKQGEVLKRKGLTIVEDAGRGYRRVVPSPKPIKIIEAKVIEKLLNQKIIVIAAGGGGIPVCKKYNELQGIEAVIDKDLASSCLAKTIKADTLINLTGINKVALNYGKKTQINLSKMTLKEAKKYLKQGHFPPGSMGPKIQAAIEFLTKGGKRVIITSPEKLEKALKGKDGTLITK